MSTEQNKVLVRRVFEEGINQGNQGVFDAVIAPNYVNHNMPAPVPGVEGFKQLIGMFRAGFPDMRVVLEDVIAEGNMVSSRGVMHGTQLGSFMDIPATGKHIEVGYIDIWRVENDKLAENWVQLDMLGMMQQLGVVPAAG